MQKIIFIELNEVPLRVIDRYVAERPDSWTARLLDGSAQYQTRTEDRIQLDPWISWPTMHRGVPDEMHQILHLGQMLDEVDEQYPPIWSLLARGGRSVGVFGSLHSNNVPRDVGDYAFYVPDFFAHDIFAKPAELLPFQELNVVMTRESARNVSKRVPMALLASAVRNFPSIGIRFATLVEGARQLVSERVDERRRIRRRNYQSLLMADAFVAQLERTKPDFATIYSNNVAAAMHRYWAALFPEDYENLSISPEWLETYRGEILAAMDMFDKMLGRIMGFVDAREDYTIAVGTSMGQGAIPCEPTDNFLTIIDLEKFMTALGMKREQWFFRPAMVPCLGIVVEEESARERLRQALSTFEIDGHRIVKDDRPLMPMAWDEKDGGFFHFYMQFDDYAGAGDVRVGNRSFTLEEVGLEKMVHEDGVNCTAQHQAEGTLLVYRPGDQDRSLCRDEISTLDFAPSVLAHFGLDKPAYMRGRPAIAF